MPKQRPLRPMDAKEVAELFSVGMDERERCLLIAKIARAELLSLATNGDPDITVKFYNMPGEYHLEITRGMRTVLWGLKENGVQILWHDHVFDNLEKVSSRVCEWYLDQTPEMMQCFKQTYRDTAFKEPIVYKEKIIDTPPIVPILTAGVVSKDAVPVKIPNIEF